MRRERGNALNRWEGGGCEEGERKCLEPVGGGGGCIGGREEMP